MAEVEDASGPMVSNQEPAPQQQDVLLSPPQEEVGADGANNETEDRRDGSKENKSPKKDESGGGGREKKDKDNDRSSRRHSRKSSRSRSGSHSPKKKDKDRDRERRKDKEKEKHKRRSRSSSRSRSRSRRRRSRSGSRGRHRHSRDSSKSPSPRRRSSKTRNWDQAPPGIIVNPQTNTVGFAPPATAASILPGMPPGMGVNLPMMLPGQLGIGGMMGAPGNMSLGVLPLAGATAAAGGNQIINGMLVTPQLLRQARRLYVGNVPITATEQDMMMLFNSHLLAAGKCTPDSLPIVSVQLNPGKGFAFLECRNPEDANNCLLFDGIPYGVNCLKIRRPKDFKPIPGLTVDPATQPPAIPGVVSTTVPDSEFKVYLGGLPQHLTEMQVRELVSSFGELKAFNLVKEAGSAMSKGYCFFEFVDHDNTEKACAGLNGFELAGKKLICQRASTNPRMAGMTDTSLAAMLGLGMMPGMGMMPQPVMQPVFGLPGVVPGATMPDPLAFQPPATKILKLSNMITAEELRQDEEYEDIVTDVKEECSKFGQVISIQIPRPVVKEDGTLECGPGVAGVYVEFSEEASSERAFNALKGRQFASRTVICSFFPETDYALKKLY